MQWGMPFRFNKNKLENQAKAANLMSRLVLRRGEIYRLPALSGSIQVVSGQAWVTVAGCDIFLGQGERLAFHSKNEPVLISGLSRMSLVLEVLSHRPTAASGAILTSLPHQPGPI